MKNGNKKSALKSAKDAKTSKSIVANIAEVGKKLEPSKTWLKTLNNNPAATASQTRQKRQKQTQTKKLLQSGVSIIAPKVKLSASDSKRLNIIFALTLAAKGYENSNLTRIDPEEYLKWQGRKITKVNIRNARREIRNTIKNYFGITTETIVNINGKRKKLTFHIFGMLAEDEDSNNNTVTDGNDILFKYDRDFFDFFTNYGKPYIMFLPMALTTLDTRRYPLAWYVGYYLARDKRNNFRNENRANIVGSILHEVGLIDENGKTNSSVYSHVIEPFLKALDKLSDGSKFPKKNGQGLNLITYTFLDKNGNKVTAFKQLPLSEFKQYRLLVHWKKYVAIPLAKAVKEAKEAKEKAKKAKEAEE